ncbi:MAG: hypothetical protein WCT32_01290 [Patescibacteria group bacterium]|jgi:hypothetical protein
MKSSKSVNYAKRGWLWLAATILLYFLYWLAALLASQYWREENFKLIVVALIYIAVTTTFLSLLNFIVTAKSRPVYYLLVLLNMVLITILVWISLIARSY